MSILLLVALSSCKEKKVAFTSTKDIQLSSPRVEVDSLIFQKEALISLALKEDRADIYYKVLGTDTEAKTAYEKPIVVDKTTKIQFWAEHELYRPSDVQEIILTKISTDLSSTDVVVAPEPHINYPGKGSATLVNSTKGTVNFRKGDEWLGFQDKKVSVSLQFSKPTPVSKVLVGVLADHNSWIFLPSSVLVEARQTSIGSIELPYPLEREKPNSTFIEVEVEKGNYKNLIINIFALESIPGWHEGKGTPPWLFVDEILIEP
ncbi:chitobiase/beta-hexosaminidase C-terminal domain-containing protein [Allomuricauda sp. SCSIO 65647]|uniref:chitobiase/beta-hexosaminidase C-terminal domain-containing protein n=1 Tax=Allomuricauda sp. SCSIO 65647 TaxID=2908843 RepID=UPI001F488B0B|nr:chitobiase/beta-hexosaminidase C-terminal domain-containing protein [Muricauda sp. SCSIO 65647]UJH67078.1 hypothetical protein L0P89_14125 [Muricauda sp. SCSIO 65647]